MGATTPQSTIKLYNAPEVNTRAGETLFFASAADREAYFATKLVATNVNCTVVKKRYNTIKVKATMATLETCNYISFINPSYGNKLFYGYIMSTDYLNNEVSLVTYNIDWFMTDMFNVHYDTEVQMVREHLTNREHTLLSTSAEFPELEKMMSPEPLNCDPYTEKLKYKTAGDCEGFLVNNYHPGPYDAWNAISNSGRVSENLNGYDTTAHASTKMIHVISFTVPRNDSSDEEATHFWNELNTLLNKVHNAHSDYTPLEYLPYFIISPQQFDLAGHSAIYFMGRHDYTGNAGSYTSWSTTVPEDTQYARPYMMVGSESMYAIQEIIDYLNSTGNVSSILGAHEMPVALLDEFFYSINATNTDSSITNASSSIKIPTPKKQTEFIANTGLDPKLHYFPYSYFTLEGVNNNSRMEFKYEMCSPSSNAITLYKGVTVNSSGTYFYVRPDKYKGSIEDTARGDDPFIPNQPLDYTMVYSDFPEIPYNTDAYAAFIAGKARELMAENTREGLYNMGAQYAGLQAKSMTSDLGIVGNLVNGIGGALGGNIGAALQGSSGAINAKAGQMAAGMQVQAMDVKGSMMDAASSTLLDPLAGTEDNPIYDNYQMSKAAYIMPNYHPGSGGGVVNLVSDSQRMGIIVRTVKRSLDFYNKYNNFFKKYGYTTADVKIPAICKYMGGDTTGNNSAYIAMAPTQGFPEGKGYSYYYYTQTKNMKVDNVCADSAIFIEHLFDGGLSLRKYVPNSN